MFWSGELQEHIIAQAVTVAFAYLFDYFCRKMLGREKSAVADSLLVACPAILFLNLLLFAGTGIGFLKLGNGWLDCLLINIVYIPLLMIYYAILRMTYMNRKYEEQQLMIEKIRGEQLQAELNSLKAQYHPHFLFNAGIHLFERPHPDEAVGRNAGLATGEVAVPQSPASSGTEVLQGGLQSEADGWIVP